MSNRPVVAVLGDLNLDVLVQVETMPPPGGEAHAVTAPAWGGSAALTARWLAALGCEVRLAAAIGEDPFGDWLWSALTRAGVPTRWIQRVPHLSTGVCLSLVQRGGERTLLASPGAARELRWEQIPVSWLEGVDGLHVSGYAWMGAAERGAAERAVAYARGRGIPVSLDPGAVAPALRPERDLLAGITLALPNRREIRDLTGEAEVPRGVMHLRGHGVEWVAVKLDAEGCLVAGPEGEVAVPPFPVVATNATGAGDAFNAGAIVGVVLGWPAERLGALANLLGGAAAQRGAAGPLPSLDELLSLLDRVPGQSTLGAWLGERWRKGER
ncbi:MAG: hypothetical protein BIP78_1497 [Candidatus Bipolaricaulis sibiricus]|uniref:Carbohydrate kinase PfkB domain-containing protein n=1 Tax=Bipolaricaulis sibiricus TaxID=2501609 RepID=A0A410FW63_BIPS1|nr:MAG: hypothetical protein BIP78_1497 [Candidatus Bipolaricaulis sibiricus]